MLQKNDLHIETEFALIDTLCVILLVGREVQLGGFCTFEVLADLRGTGFLCLGKQGLWDVLNVTDW